MNRREIAVNIDHPWRVSNGKARAPVTIITEGVHVGSRGAVYWAAHILRENANKWEGVPITIDHPKINGDFVGVNKMPRDIIIGAVRSPYFDEAKKAICGTIEVDAALLPKIANIREVSAGCFADEVYTTGTWNHEGYGLCCVTMEPDHLALLPGGRGACSWEDGCGIRANAENDALREIAVNIFNALQGRETHSVGTLLPPGVGGQ